MSPETEVFSVVRSQRHPGRGALSTGQYYSVMVAMLSRLLALLLVSWLLTGSLLAPLLVYLFFLLSLFSASLTPPPPLYWPGSVWTFPDASD